MPYKRKKRLFGKLPQRPFEIIRVTGEAVLQTDHCLLITTKQNREFLATLERDYGVARTCISKIIRDTYHQDIVFAEILDSGGGSEYAYQGKTIVKGYSKAIGALQKLLTDTRLDEGFREARLGRMMTARDVIREDIGYLVDKQRRWAWFHGVHPELWADTRPTMATLWKYQAALLHHYITGCIGKTARARGQGRDSDEKHDAKIYRLLSELLRQLYKHPAFDGARRLSQAAIKTMVGNVCQNLGEKERNRFPELAKRILDHLPTA